MRTLLVTYTVIIAIHASPPTTWLRVHENDVIMGTRQVTHMVTSALSPITCLYTCRDFDWCSVFVANDLAGTCELRDLPRISLNISTSPHSSYWEVLALNDWCPVDDGFQFSAAARFCFIVVTNLSANWTDSRNECKRRGLDLVVLDTTLKQNIVLKYIKNTPGSGNLRYFLGATRPMADINLLWKGDITKFDWINGAPVNLTKDLWGVGQPNNYGHQNCLLVDGPQGVLLNDYECYRQNHLVCEKSMPIR